MLCASISDEIPDWLSNALSNIEVLDLFDNIIKGNIPQINEKKMLQLHLVSLCENNLVGDSNPLAFTLIYLSTISFFMEDLRAQNLNRHSKGSGINFL